LWLFDWLSRHEENRKIILDFILNKDCFLSKSMATKAHNNFLDLEAGIAIDRCMIVIHYDSDRIEKTQMVGWFFEKEWKSLAKDQKDFEQMPMRHAVVCQWSILKERSRIQQWDQCILVELNNSAHMLKNLQFSQTDALENANFEILKSLTRKMYNRYWFKWELLQTKSYLKVRECGQSDTVKNS
jgi:RecG-like helicase